MGDTKESPKNMKTIDDIIHEKQPEFKNVLDLNDFSSLIESEIERRIPNLEIYYDLNEFKLKAKLLDPENWKLKKLQKVLQRGKKQIAKIEQEMQRATTEAVTCIVNDLQHSGELERFVKYVETQRQKDDEFYDSDDSF